ncbi:hypothetical protein LSAT2_010739 [Lamellibrachia satsuma]|nr:hypothetical protein LSAT2_010739 [Lamellibrachia satsuma]
MISNYARSSSYVLGGIQVGGEVALLIVNIVVITTFGVYFQTVTSGKELVPAVIAYIVVYFVESVASIWSGVICYKTSCCGQRSAGAIVRQTVTTGTVVDTIGEPTQAGESNSFSEISFGPTPVYDDPTRILP